MRKSSLGRFVNRFVIAVAFLLFAATQVLSQGNSSGFSTLFVLSGSGFENITAFDINPSGDVFAAGITNSTDFPMANAVQGQFAGGFQDFFVARVDTSTGTPVYSTYLGGSGDEFVVSGLVLDSADNAYVIGETKSTDFPTLNPFQTASGGLRDVVVAKFAPDGTLLFATYLGGDGDDNSGGIALDSGGNIWLCGTTRSANFPTTANALQDTSAGDRDVFLTKLSADGSTLLYSTYLGGLSADNGSALMVDAQGVIFVAGGTRSDDFAGQTLMSSAAFVAKLSDDGQNVSLDTVVVADGSEFDSASSLADAESYIFFAGSAGDGLPTTTGAEQPDYGGFGDGMVGAFYKPTMGLAYLSYQGTADNDIVTDIAVQVMAPAGSAGQGLKKTGGSSGGPTDVKVATTSSTSGFEETSGVGLTWLTGNGSGFLMSEGMPRLTVNVPNSSLNEIVAGKNACFAAGTIGDLTTSDGVALVVPEPQGAPKLEIEKTVVADNDPILVGDRISFLVTVSNSGTAPATSVTVFDSFDDDNIGGRLINIESPVECRIIPEEAFCTVAALDPGET
ncbi:MAG: hypothetical protein D6743_12995, partial [Calditrichaeota bacterium]